MSHLYIVICLFAFAAYSISGQEGNDDEAIRRGNAYIDQLLKDMFDSDTDKFDPYEMEDSVVGFHKKIMFVNVTGEAKLYDGSLKGLSTLHRTDNCVLHEEGERLKVNAKLGAGVLNFLYKGSAKFMNFGPTITVHGDLAFVEVDIEFTVDAKTGKNGKLTKFMIDDMRDMRVWVTGLGPINWAVNPIIKAVTKIFKRILRYFLENRVQKYIDNRLPNYKFPVEGGGITDSPLTKPTEPEETTQTTEQELTTQTAEPETTTVELTTITPEPEVTTVEQTTVTTENEITTPELTSQPPEPDTITPTPEEPTTTVTEEPETQTSEIIETTATEEPETQTPEVTETPVPEEPETPAPEEPETPVPEEPETPVPEEPETPVPEEPDTPVPEEPETPVPEEPETPVPEEPETPPTEEPAEL